MKEKKEYELKQFSSSDKKGFAKLLALAGTLASMNIGAITTLAVFHPPLWILQITILIIVYIFAFIKQVDLYGEEAKNYLYSKKYSKKYYDDINEKIYTVQRYINDAKTLKDSYFISKRDNSLSEKSLEDLKFQAYEKALEANMICNIHHFNLSVNEKYFNDMITRKDNISLSVWTNPGSFDLTEKEARALQEKYMALENKLKTNCNVRFLDLTQTNDAYKITVRSEKANNTVLNKINTKTLEDDKNSNHME